MKRGVPLETYRAANELLPKFPNRAADVLIVQTMKITTPTEIEQYVLTQIRRELAVALVSVGTQKDVADMLRVSTATVTHYVKGQRATTGCAREY